MQVTCPECKREHPAVSENAVAAQMFGTCFVCREESFKLPFTIQQVRFINEEFERLQPARCGEATEKNISENDAYTEEKRRNENG